DLMEEASFHSAIEGCHGVFHVASPVIVGDVEDPQKEIIDPAVKGTINVLKSCANTPSVKRVVLTSSMATNLFTGKPITSSEDVIDETLFSDPDICRESKMWYLLSKILAEDAAWKFVKENNIDMVCINPGMVAGPLLQPEINFSVTPILNLINGTKTFPNLSYPWVNVKDVANFHILAYEVASASGRYCLAERVVHFSELATLLCNLYPTLQIANKCEDDKPYVPTYQVSEKAKSLGIRFIPLEVTLKETVECFRENNIFNF
ncbi:hypothetical protein PIB30_055173, partial [Stylosanthes scabra]|nr:hypothetical protein [Stylosanthes scabra]